VTEEETQIESVPIVPPPSGQAKEFRSAFFDVAPAMFLGTLDQTIIAAALPAITSSLGGFSYLAWVVSAYLLAATIAAPIYGRMGDAFGRRKMLVWALALFIAGSVACALSPNLTVLVCARGLQGFGGGGLMTLSQALIGEVVSPKERGRFQGWFGANFALASTLGPVAGGFLSQHFAMAVNLLGQRSSGHWSGDRRIASQDIEGYWKLSAGLRGYGSIHCIHVRATSDTELRRP